jgi:hypothetical protein
MANIQPIISRYPAIDHFHAHYETTLRAEYHLLGCHYTFESNNRRLINLAAYAFAGVPKHRFPGRIRRFNIRLLLQDSDGNERQLSKVVPEINMYYWNGVFCATMDPGTISMISPQTASAQIFISKQMMAFPYNVRYELIEYAVTFLAQHSRNNVSLNGACIALNGKGIVLIGGNGAGKSTTSLACLGDGFEFIAEEGLVVCTTTLLVTGLSSFIHLRPDCLRFFKATRKKRSKQTSTLIVRRSGVSKFEIDTRKLGVRLARSTVKIHALVFLTGRNTCHSSILTPLSRAESRCQLEKTQSHVSWFSQSKAVFQRLSRVPAYAVVVGDHPKSTVAALRKILA